jgi:hypothetical protein
MNGMPRQPRTKDFSKLEGVFTDNNREPEYEDRLAAQKERLDRHKKTGLSLTFLNLLDKELYDKFKCRDWLDYFIYKASTQGISYKAHTSSTMKELKVMGALMKSYSPSEIKGMIDFLYEADHDLVASKRLINVFMLTGGWINTVYQSSIMWKDGTFDSLKKKPVPTHNREYIKSDKPKSEKGHRNRVIF